MGWNKSIVKYINGTLDAYTRLETDTKFETHQGATDKANAAEAAAKSYVDQFAQRTDNPHKVTKDQVGLDKVLNVEQASQSEFIAHNYNSIRHVVQSDKDKWNAFDNHAALASATGTQVLTQNTNNTLSILDSVTSNLPANSVATGSGAYTVPRKGLYMCVITLAPLAITQANSVIQLGVKIAEGENVVENNTTQLVATSASPNGLFSSVFTIFLNENTVVTPFVNPLNEEITIQAGTKYTITLINNSSS
ncbi:hypothetical protein QO179_24595 [Bacillus stercoris]|nr:hypothetical protein [Bacillus stercoris]